MAQNGPATPAKLVRRLSLDLTGLPPTPEEVAAFVKDPSEQAYEQLVDRLLHSPHYGEHMAAGWLDAARYADSHGFQTDSSRSMWPWRDWVIRSFNENLPFDQFTLFQLAGDLLPNPSQEQLVATGFNRNHRINGEGGLIAEEWRIENIMDRVETTGTTWLALTFNCCRCHDHKYDPISQKEFYQMFAFFNNVDETGTIQGAGNRSGGNPDPYMSVVDAGAAAQLDQLRRALGAAKAARDAQLKTLPEKLAAWEKTALETLTMERSSWTLVEPKRVASSLGREGAVLKQLEDLSWLATGPNPPQDTYEVEADLPREGVTALLLECLPDASLPRKSLGRFENGNFVLTDVRVSYVQSGAKAVPLSVVKAEADYSQKGYEAAQLGTSSADVGARRTGWAVNGTTKKDARYAKFTLSKSIPAGAKGKLVVKLVHAGIGGHNIGRFRLSSSGLPPGQLALRPDGQFASVLAALRNAPDKRSEAQRKAIAAYFKERVPGPIQQTELAVKQKQAALDDAQTQLPTTMVMKELMAPRSTFTLKRGEYDKPGDEVRAGTPAALPAMIAGSANNRLGLAQWMVQPQHPLTARVWVNRAWEHFFGIGLVKTTENFGMQADYPSHPALLDWLATEFVRSGWNMKAIHKLLVMSHTYRQSATVTPEQLAADPENRLLARASRVRLRGEVLRDQALFQSGLLVPKVGGPSVRPYMPEGVWDETSKYGNLRGYEHQKDEGLYRRTLYTIWKRTAGPPTMLIFDSPTREVCTVKRSRTNTPLQALALLNEVTYVEAARVLAEGMLRNAGADPTAQIRWATQRVLQRDPSAAELELLLKGMQERLSFFGSQPQAAKALLAAGERKAAGDLPVDRLAAAAMTANVLLNLDEVITRE
jgi:hypothetical protein